MNTEQIIQEEVENFVINTEYVLLADPLRHAIRQAIKREREACARVCEKIDEEYEGEDVLATWCAAAIRARGNE
jgi:hypothetical protein